MSLPITPSEFAVGFAIAVFGATIQGLHRLRTGSRECADLVDGRPQFRAGSLLVAAMMLSALMVIRERDSIVLDEVVFSSLGRIVTTIPAARWSQTFAKIAKSGSTRASRWPY